MNKTPETSEVLNEEDQDQVGRAALLLASWQDTILERKTFNKLQKMKRATLSACESREDSNEQKKPAPLPNVPCQIPEPGNNIDGTKLPDYPPLPNLRDRIIKISPPFLKQLTPSDVADNLSRISLNSSFAEEHYLPMLNGNEDLKEGVKVTTYGPDGLEHPMNFRIWGGGKTYVLNCGWKSFCEKHNLKACLYWITVWMFRDNTDRLCFAIDWINNESTPDLILTRSKGLIRTG